MSDVVEYNLDGRIAVITLNSPPVNALGAAVRTALQTALRRFRDDQDARAALLCGAGRLFTAGADIREFGKPMQPPLLPELIGEVEALSKPVVVAIHGTTLGGGLELSLGSHYRVAAADTKVGLPEVHIGLLPGAGGTQRLPRLVGIEAAAEIISSGRHVPAAEALSLGILDALADQSGADAARAAGIAFANRVIDENLPPRRTGELDDKLGQVDLAPLRARLERRARGQLSPLYCVDAVEAAGRLPFADGLKRERELFVELMQSPQRAALIHAFFAEREAGKIPELELDAEPRELRRVGVIGGGTMGSGISSALLYAGFEVAMVERDADAADAGRGRVTAVLDDGVKRGKLDPQRRDRLLAGFDAGSDLAALADADLIIEAAFEDMGVKQELFRQIDRVAKSGAVLASNTSYLDVDQIAAVTGRPADVLGLHFFSPAHVMKLVEVVVGERSSPAAVLTGFALAKRLGKVAVRAGVCDGFIGNRILERYLRATSMMVEDGASPYDIDDAFIAFGYPMGPYQMSDLAGIDIGWANRKRKLAEGYPGRYPHTFMDKVAELGHYGRKTGRGFYRYEQQPGGARDDEVLALIDQVRRDKNITPQSFDRAAITRRFVAAIVNEGAKIVEQGIALRPLDVDVTLLYGYGFPRWRGGPMHYADQVGLQRILADLREFAADGSEGSESFWQPAALIERLAADAQSFDSLNRKGERG